MSNPDSRIFRIVFIVGEVLTLVGFLGLFLWLLKEVIDGNGTNLYQSHWGLNFSPIGVLIFLGVCVVAGFIALYFIHREKKEEEDLLEKYGEKKNREK